MKILKSIIIISGFFLVASVQAATVFTSPAVTVSSVIPGSGGSVIVGVVGITTNENPAGCANAGFLIDPAAAGAKNMYATVLTAMASGGTVLFGIDDTNCSAGGFPSIDGLIVSP